MRRILCFIGVHHWEHHVNPAMEGRNNGWDLCSRCGREKPPYALEGGVPSFRGDGGRRT